MDGTLLRLAALVLSAAPLAVRAQASYPARTAELVANIGRDSAKHVAVGAVRAFDIARNGDVYMIDAAADNIKVFTGDGAFARVFAPALKFSGLYAISVGDTLVTIQDRGHGLIRLTPGGQEKPPVAASSISEAQLRHGQRLSLIDDPQQPTPRRFIVLRAEKGRADTLLTIVTDNRVSQDSTAIPPRSRSTGFGDSGAWALSGDSLLAVADGYTGSVKWYDLTSGPRLIRTATPGTLGAHPRSVATRALFADDGALWVGQPRLFISLVPEWTITVETNTWTVFPPRGAPFTVVLPANFPLQAVNHGRLFGRPSSYNQATIMVYRIRE
jgi:hypothetical protein